MPIQRSISITEAQDEWLNKNNISLSKLVQKAVENYINSEAINDSTDKVVRNMLNEIKARGFIVEIRKLKASK